MLRNIELVTKIFMGFICILALLGGVAFMGYKGTSLMADKIKNTNDVERITRLISQSRQQEKNFILRGEQQYADSVTATLLDLRRQAQATKENFTQQLGKEHMDRVMARTDEYATAFGSYVEAEREQEAMLDVMRAQARETLLSISEIRDDLAEQLAEKRRMSATEEQKQRRNVDDAARIITWILKAVTEEKNFIFEGHREEYVAATKTFFSDALVLVRVLKMRIRKSDELFHVDIIGTLAEKHLNDFTRYVELEGAKTVEMRGMSEDSSNVKLWSNTLRIDIRNQLLRTWQDASDSARRLKGQMTSLEHGNDLLKWSLEALIEEKIYLTTKDVKRRNSLKGLVNQILASAKSVSAKSVSADQSKAADRIVELSESYLIHLKSYHDIQYQQDLLEERLLSSAAQLEKEAELIAESQREELRVVQLQTGLFIDDKLAKANDSNRLIMWFLDARKNEKEFILSGEEQYAMAVYDNLQQILTLAGDLQQRFTLEHNLELLDAVSAAIQAYHTAFTTVVGVMERQAEAEHQMLQAARDAQQACDELREAQRGEMFTQMSRTNAFFFIIPPVAIVIGLSIAAGISYALRASLLKAVTMVQNISEGDLSQNIDVARRDEIGRLLHAMNVMTDRLQEMLGKIKIASGRVATGSQQMRGNAEEIAEGANEQAASVEEVLSSMEEMAATIRQNTDNALQTEQIALKAVADAQSCGKTVAEAIFAMQDIAKKIRVIGDIAKQTRLLSLNASIEAARVQERGQGFAVVASEVRALSDHARLAAEEINTLASSGVYVAEAAGDMLMKLIPDIGDTANLVQEISVASREQNAGIGQINQAIQQLDQVIQQNASASQEMASTSAELFNQAEMLQSSILFFKTDETENAGVLTS